MKSAWKVSIPTAIVKDSQSHHFASRCGTILTHFRAVILMVLIPAVVVGRVAELWRYPVKSMQGERIQASALTDRGVLGDRAYAVVDTVTGHVASAKHPRKWRALIQCSARYLESPADSSSPPPPLELTLPDGARIRSDAPSVHRRLSKALGREVRLVTTVAAGTMREADRTPAERAGAGETITVEPLSLGAPPGTFFDYAPIHLLTTATLNRCRELYPGGQFAVERFRPNLLIDTGAAPAGFFENGWLGGDLTLGNAARLRMIDPCPRCVITTLGQHRLDPDPKILQTIARHNAVASLTLLPGTMLHAVAGVYGSVITPGPVRQGHPVTWTPE